MRRFISSVFVLVVAAGWARPQAQEQASIAHVRDLYSNAAYEDVLSAVAADATSSPEIGQYKVFSLIALGRPADAEKAAEAVLEGHLAFHPDSDTPPRLLDLFASARRRMAPDALKSMYVNARSAFDRKDRDAAIRAFAELVSIAADPDLKDDAGIGELRLLAGGFLELSSAIPVAKPEQDSTGLAMGRTPAVTVSPPRPMQEEWPRWVPTAALAQSEYRGKILVHVGVNGKVESARITQSVDPLYDDLLLKASKTWLYQPGLSNGKPVPADRLVEIVLKPRPKESTKAPQKSPN